MTTYVEESITCTICGRESRHTLVNSTNTFGGTPDLDLRPPPMHRDTMHCWLHVCPGCGYVAPHLAHADAETRHFMFGEGWAALKRSMPVSADRFDIRAAIKEAVGNDPLGAAQAVLHVAWGADDYQSAKTARTTRCRAAVLFRRALSQGDLSPERTITVQLVLIDVLRRSQQWGEALAMCRTLDAENLSPVEALILRFQQN